MLFNTGCVRWALPNKISWPCLLTLNLSRTSTKNGRNSMQACFRLTLLGTFDRIATYAIICRTKCFFEPNATKRLKRLSSRVENHCAHGNKMHFSKFEKIDRCDSIHSNSVWRRKISEVKPDSTVHLHYLHHVRHHHHDVQCTRIRVWMPALRCPQGAGFLFSGRSLSRPGNLRQLAKTFVKGMKQHDSRNACFEQRLRTVECLQC